MDFWAFRPFVSRGGGYIDSYPDGSPTGWKWHEGMPLSGAYPKDASIEFSGNFPKDRELRDFQPNMLHALIASPRALAILAEHEVPGLELLPIAVKDHSGEVVGPGYAFVNPLGGQDAIDLERSKFSWSALNPTQLSEIDHLVLSPARIAPDAKLFRCAAMHRLFLLRDDLKQAFDRAGLTGCRCFPAEGWNGLDIG